MAQHHHGHSHSETHSHSVRSEMERRRLHKDWRAWVIVGFMLAAMIVYVLTLDDSIIPAIMGGR